MNARGTPEHTAEVQGQSLALLFEPMQRTIGPFDALLCQDAEQDVLGSLAVAFAADVVQHAHVYAVAPRRST